MPKVLYPCGFLYPPIVPKLVIYNGAEFNGPVHIHYYSYFLLAHKNQNWSSKLVFSSADFSFGYVYYLYRKILIR